MMRTHLKQYISNSEAHEDFHANAYDAPDDFALEWYAATIGHSRFDNSFAALLLTLVPSIDTLKIGGYTSRETRVQEPIYLVLYAAAHIQKRGVTDRYSLSKLTNISLTSRRFGYIDIKTLDVLTRISSLQSISCTKVWFDDLVWSSTSDIKHLSLLEFSCCLHVFKGLIPSFETLESLRIHIRVCMSNYWDACKHFSEVVKSLSHLHLSLQELRITHTADPSCSFNEPWAQSLTEFRKLRVLEVEWYFLCYQIRTQIQKHHHTHSNLRIFPRRLSISEFSTHLQTGH